MEDVEVDRAAAASLSSGDGVAFVALDADEILDGIERRMRERCARMKGDQTALQRDTVDERRVGYEIRRHAMPSRMFQQLTRPGEGGVGGLRSIYQVKNRWDLLDRMEKCTALDEFCDMTYAERVRSATVLEDLKTQVRLLVLGDDDGGAANPTTAKERALKLVEWNGILVTGIPHLHVRLSPSLVVSWRRSSTGGAATASASSRAQRHPTSSVEAGRTAAAPTVKRRPSTAASAARSGGGGGRSRTSTALTSIAALGRLVAKERAQLGSSTAD